MSGLHELLSTDLVYRLGWTLVHSLWQGVAVAGVFGLLLLVLPVSRPNVRYLAGCCSLLLIVAMSGITFLAIDVPAQPLGTAASLLPPPRAVPAMVRPDTGEPRVPEAMPETPAPASDIAPLSGGEVLSVGLAPPEIVASPPSPPRPWTERLVRRAQPGLPWLALAWLLGVAGLSIWRLGGCVAAYRLRAMGTGPAGEQIAAIVRRCRERLRISRPVRVLRSVAIRTPAVIGHFRPVILLPVSTITGLSTEQLEAIVAHELAHIRRYDYLAGLVQSAVEILLFHHPAVWWISQRIRSEREYCCDDMVLSIGKSRLVYAQSLAMLAPLAGRPVGVAAAATGGSLVERIRRLACPAAHEHLTSGRSVAGLILAALLVLTVAATARHILAGPSAPGGEMRASENKPAGVVDLAGNEGFPWVIRLQRQPEKPLVVEGRVVDSAGKPMEKAEVAVVAELPNEVLAVLAPQTLGSALTDAKGAFRISAPSLPLHQCSQLVAMARRDGYGFASQNLDPAGFEHHATFQLKEERTFAGRVLDDKGQPASGVPVQLWGLGGRTASGEHVSYPVFYAWPPVPFPSAWPPIMTSDDQGRFVLRGLPQSSAVEWVLSLRVDDPRFAPGTFHFRVPSSGAKDMTMRMTAPRVVDGVVLCHDTKAPMAGAWLRVAVCNSGSTGDLQWYGVPVKTDEQGKFQARCGPGEFLTIYVYPPAGIPYPAWVTESAPWPADSLRQVVTVEVPRGVLVRGKIVEEGSGASVAGATVEYQLCRDRNPHFERPVPDQIYWAAEARPVVAGEDGTFELGVVGGPGYLLVKAPGPEFVSRLTTNGDLQDGRAGGPWYSVEGLLKIDPEPASQVLQVTIPLRRGVTVRGRVTGPHGEAVDRADLVTESYFRPIVHCSGPDSLWVRPVREGRFELQGCDPDKPQRVYFLDTAHQWGAVAMLEGGKAQQEEPTIRLQPCGSAKARIVDQDGRPVSGQLVCSYDGPPLAWVHLVLAEGQDNKSYGSRKSPLTWDLRTLLAGQYRALRSDAEGRVTFPTLVPGALYHLAGFGRSEPNQKKDFRVEPGQEVDLGNIVVQTPQGPEAMKLYQKPGGESK